MKFMCAICRVEHEGHCPELKASQASKWFSSQTCKLKVPLICCPYHEAEIWAMAIKYAKEKGIK